MRTYYYFLLLSLGLGLNIQSMAQDISISQMKANLKKKMGSFANSAQPNNPSGIESGTFTQIELGHTQKTESEVHAAISPADTNKMIAAVMRYDINNTAAPLSFSLYSTSNFGQNWTESTFRGEIPGNTAPAGGGDPLVAYESNGKVHFVWLALTFNSSSQNGDIGIYHASSTNNGFTWNTPSSPVYSGKLGLDPNTNEVIATDRYVDKPWLAVDRSNDALYVAFYNLELQPDTLPSIRCIRKSKNASTFSSSSVQVHTQTYEDLQFASIDVGSDGVVHVSFWGSIDGTNYALYHVKSENGGNSFQPETKISDIAFPVPDQTLGFPVSDLTGVERLYPCPQLRVDKTNGPRAGNLYMAWTAYGINSRVSNGYDIYFSRSIDGGDTWSNPVIVNDDNDPDNDQFYPSLEVSPKGLLVLSWYDRRNDPQNVDTEYFMTWSKDGGLSFSDQFSVSEQPSDFTKIGDKNDGFGVGEYTQIITTPNQAIPFWADGRANNGRVKVYAGFVPLTEEPVVSIREWQSLQTDFSIKSLISMQPGQWKIAWKQNREMRIEGGLYNIAGNKVLTFPSQRCLQGEHELIFQTQRFPAGVYLVKIKTASGIWNRRIIVE